MARDEAQRLDIALVREQARIPADAQAELPPLGQILREFDRALQMRNRIGEELARVDGMLVNLERGIEDVRHQRVVFDPLYYNPQREDFDAIINVFSQLLETTGTEITHDHQSFLKHCRELITETTKLEREFPKNRGFYCNMIAAAINMISQPREDKINFFKSLADVSYGLDNIPRTRLQKLSALILIIGGIALAALSAYKFFTTADGKSWAETSKEEQRLLTVSSIGYVVSMITSARAITFFGGTPAVPKTEMKNLAADLMSHPQPRAV